MKLSESPIKAALVVGILFMGMGHRATLASDRTFPEIVNMVPDEIFVPPGFDDNDRAQVVLSGSFPNTCYKVAPGKSRVDAAKKKIYVENQVYYYASGWCLQVIVPYSQTIELGVLEAGSYDIMAMDNGGRAKTMGKITIAKSTNPGPDDYLYANVTDARIEKASDGNTLVVNGTLGNDCMFLKEVRAVRRVSNVLEVFPIVELKQNTVCKEVPYPFETKVKVDGTTQARTLIHVRSLNGQAINKVVEF